MKKWLCILGLSIAFYACGSKSGNETETASLAQSGTDSTGNPTMVFKRDVFDFGTIVTGAKVKHDFEFKNTGDAPLIITSAMATCGCTVPEYPNHPIAPGEEGVITAVYDSEGQHGKQDKQITITANTQPQQNVLNIVGEVLEKQ